MFLSRKHRLLFLVLTLLASLLTAPVLLAEDDDDDGGGTTATAANRCVVKFVCGEADDESLRAIAGFYRTAINVFNAGTETVNYTKKVGLTAVLEEDLEEWETPGGPAIGPIVGAVLMMEGFDVDCREIFQEFGVTDDFAEGFLVLESDGPLTVTAVYTAGAEEEGVTSIDVEPVTCTESAVKSSSGDDDDDD